MKWILPLIYLFVSFEVFGYTDCACTYHDINTSLNTCVKAATSSTTVRWFFPHGTLAQQKEFCQGSAQTTLKSCINGVFSSCTQEAKSLKMFGTKGDNLVNAYTGLCSASLNTEAQACMSVVSTTTSFTTAESTFKAAVTSLPDDASAMEICGLATTMKFTAYTTLLSKTCTDSSHLAVWGTFYSTIMDTYVCATCTSSSSERLDHTVVYVYVCMLAMLVYMICSIE